MYQNMTREEMIQRLYEGNFTTGELERQLIAKLFEQCCGGEGSSGGETLIVEIEPIADESKADRTLRVAGGDIEKKFNKTAKEVFDACKTSNDVIFVETGTETNPNLGLITVTNIYSLTAMQHMTDGSHSAYVFELTGVDEPFPSTYPSTSTRRYIAENDNAYPSTDWGD